MNAVTVSVRYLDGGFRWEIDQDGNYSRAFHTASAAFRDAWDFYYPAEADLEDPALEEFIEAELHLRTAQVKQRILDRVEKISYAVEDLREEVSR